MNEVHTATQKEPSRHANRIDHWCFSYTCHVPKLSDAEALFIDLSSAYWGKQYYFNEPDGSWYSRATGEMISFQEAINEFKQELIDGRS